MPKLLPFLLSLSVLMSACQSEPVELGNTLEDALPVEEAAVEESPEDVLTETHFEADRGTTVVTSDYTLVDNTGYGFAYDASNVLDQDFSTAWCQSELDPEVDGPFAGGMTLTFTESPAGKMMGIVPGFARDETIYWQNNRIKQLVLQNGPSPILEDNIVFDLEDSYGMQFIQLPEGVDENLTFYVSEVYPGSKYSDTCVAEVDLWSDYVENEDAEAAYDYYLENKAEQAKRPVDIVGGIDMVFADDYLGLSPDEVTYECGAIDLSQLSKDALSMGGFAYKNADGEWLGTYSPFIGSTSEHGIYWSSAAGNIPILSAQLNEWGKAGDAFDVRWIQTSSIGPMAQARLIETESVVAKSCADGSLYISDAFEGEGIKGVGNFTLEIYYQGHLVGRTAMSLGQ